MSERELFNQWFKKNFKDLYEAICCGDLVANNYKKAMYKAWKASSNRQGYKLIPVEPTEKMIDAGVDESDVDWKRLKFAYQAMIGAVE